MGGIHSVSTGGAVYRFSRRIGRGGMGEVYLGMQEGIGGLERLVVIKRLCPQYTANERFTRMLLEEARLAASIHHPNVVQVLDIGRDEVGYFIVMEYLSGETLLHVSRSLRTRSERVPQAIACRFAAEVAAGLHWAHTAKDPAGNPRPIVHRDVTPSNLILCFNGVVKIVDFGVAKATPPDGHTLGGLKGKMSYLAPEQLRHQPIDGRTDVFQLGICLHEVLTGERLFKAETDKERAVAVLERPIPAPSELEPSIPRWLDEVVLWALDRDPARRPATADDFRRALESAGSEIGSVSGHELGGWMRSTFATRLAERSLFERRCVALMRAGRGADSTPGEPEPPAPAPDDSSDQMRPPLIPITVSLTPPPPGGEPEPPPSAGSSPLWPLATSPSSADASPAPAPRSHTDGDGELAPSREESRSEIVSLARPPSRGTWAAIGAAALLVPLAAGTIIFWHLLDSPPPASPAAPIPAPRVVELARPAALPGPSSSLDVALVVTPAHAVIEIDGFEVGRGSYKATLPVDGTRHTMTVRAQGHESFTIEFSDEPPPARIELERVRVPPERRSPGRTVRRAPLAPSRARRARKERRAEPEPARRPRTDDPDPWPGGSGAGRSKGRDE
jgi:eukaryotic-like serine/threonine-protein kinase